MDGENQDIDTTGTNVPTADPPKKVKKRVPQANVDEFWTKFTTKFPGKVHTILPKNNYAKTKAAKNPEGIIPSQSAGKSYEEASAECVAAVEKIAKECRRLNLKYRDPHFDIEWDLKCRRRDCLDGLVSRGWEMAPRSVKRISYIFDKPVFYDDGASASDVRQGANGDCWFMSALCALGNKNLIDKVCVHRDEQVGVYGFVFHRDGEWIQTIIDDKLYLIAADFDESDDPKYQWQQLSMQDPEEEYRKQCQSGSRALYFAQCSSENETWLPLLEKAYAKAHGDFNAIQGGFTGEGIEDLTGGVTTELFTSDILDTEKFWTEELMKVNKDFLFSCATGIFENWEGTNWSTTDRKGVHAMHAYGVMDAREVKGEKLVLVRNPWGQSEWKGAWSDGSEQWTPEWMQLLNHRFGDDGMFWISYKDLLSKYQTFDRTRLFGDEWSITQQWTTIDVAWSADYVDTKFSITLTQKGPAVIVLSQLDDRYYKGLEGQYDFSLQFRLEKDGKDGESDYICRSHGNYEMNRSVNVDLEELEAGTYSVLIKITARRWPLNPTAEEVIRTNCRDRPDKLIQVGLSYDLAHAKGQFKETEAEKKEHEAREEKKKAAEKKKLRAELRESKFKAWQLNAKQRARDKRHAKKKEDRHRKRAEAKADQTPVDIEDPNADDKPVTDSAVSIADSKADPSPVPAEVTEPNFETAKLEQDAATLPSPGPDGEPIEPTEPSLGDKSAVEEEVTAADLSKNFQTALQAIPSVVINGDSPADNPAPASTVVAPSVAGVPPAIDSDYDSDVSFDSSIDSDLDFPEPPSEAPADVTEPAPAAENEDDPDEEFENDPWNAVCVVGLRVYSKDKGASVEIIRPKLDDDEDASLDVDDVSKGASGEPVGDKIAEAAEKPAEEDNHIETQA